MKKIIVTGSLAYDNLLFFDGKFENEILPEKIGHLSVSFYANEHEVFFGGCAGNIAYSLKMLGMEPMVLSILGSDRQRYLDWLKNNQIDVSRLVLDDKKTGPAAYILTDNVQNQFSIFSTGAMSDLSLGRDAGDFNEGEVQMAILAPELPERVQSLARSIRRNKIPYIFDPGQAITSFEKDVMEEIINSAYGVILNDYEFDILLDKLKFSVNELLENCNFLIKTLGIGGAELHTREKVIHIPAVQNVNVIDPTGCGDSFRAGFLYGLVNGYDLEICTKMGNVTASIALRYRGTQNHHLTPDILREMMMTHYGVSIE